MDAIEIAAREALLNYEFYKYTCEDLSKYPKANTILNPRTDELYYDEDGDWLIGPSGGLLPNMNFVFMDMHKFTVARDTYVRNSALPRESNPLFDDTPPDDKLGNYGPSYYTKKYYYCPYAEDTSPYDEFWYREEQRRIYGYTAKCKLYKRDVDAYWSAHPNYRDKYLHPLTITGDHYSFLNYSVIERFLTKSERADLMGKGIPKYDIPKTKREFPLIWDGQYWLFKLDLFCRRNGYHEIVAKARRKGVSYCKSSNLASYANLFRESSAFIVSEGFKYTTEVGGLATFTQTTVDFLEDNTGFARNCAKPFTIDNKAQTMLLGYYQTIGGTKKLKGYKSSVSVVTCTNDPSCVRGKGASKIVIEEGGSCSNLSQLLTASINCVEQNGVARGVMECYGTGGTKEAFWEGFKSVFYSPSGNHFVEMENIYDNGKRNTTCGYFFPNVMNYQGYYDENGNSDIEGAFIHDYIEKERYRRTQTTEKYMLMLAENANRPEEAFGVISDNVFMSPGLLQHYNTVLHNPDVTYNDCLLVRNKHRVVNAQDVGSLKLIDPDRYKQYYFIDTIGLRRDGNTNGCWRIYDAPYRDDKGNIPDNLYYITYDPIGKEDTVSGTDVLSLACILVWMYPNAIHESGGDILCAEFLGRYTFKELDDEAFKACDYYNAKLLYESNRGETKTNAYATHHKHLLLKDPTVKYAKRTNISLKVPDGINMTTDKKTTGLLYLKDWLYASNDDADKPVYNYHKLKSYSFLNELIHFNGTGNFDRISAAIMMPYQRMAYISSALQPNVVGSRNTLYDAVMQYESMLELPEPVSGEPNSLYSILIDN